MALFEKKWRSPQAKTRRFREQLKEKKVIETGKELTAEEIAWRKGYTQCQAEHNSLYRYNNSTDLERAAYKEEQKRKRAEWKAKKQANGG